MSLPRHQQELALAAISLHNAVTLNGIASEVFNAALASTCVDHVIELAVKCDITFDRGGIIEFVFTDLTRERALV